MRLALARRHHGLRKDLRRLALARRHHRHKHLRRLALARRHLCRLHRRGTGSLGTQNHHTATNSFQLPQLLLLHCLLCRLCLGSNMPQAQAKPQQSVPQEPLVNQRQDAGRTASRASRSIGTVSTLSRPQAAS